MALRLEKLKESKEIEDKEKYKNIFVHKYNLRKEIINLYRSLA